MQLAVKPETGTGWKVWWCVLACLICVWGTRPVVAQQTDETDNVKKSSIDEIEVRVKTLSEAIQLASEQLKAATQDDSVRLQHLDDVIGAAKSALGELNDGGELFDMLQQAIQDTEEKQKKYKDKSVDPNVSAKIREQYDKLSRRFGDLINQLYDKKILINKQRGELEDTLKEFTDQREFFADLMKANELEAANDTLLMVLESVNDLNSSFNDFAGKFVGEQEAPTETTHQ